MKFKRFKLIYLPEGTSTKREFFIGKKHILIYLSVVLAIFFTLSGGSAYLFNSWFNAKKISALSFKNIKLEKQLKIAREKIEGLTQKTELLAESTGELRAYVHLPLLDADLLKVGIGGALPYQPSDSTGAEDLLARLDQLERQVGLQENSLVEVKTGLEDQAAMLKSLPSLRPVSGGAFSSLFGNRRDPINGRWDKHPGVDINCAHGTPVHAPADGVVIHAEREPAYGNVIVIDHGHGYRTLYAHLSRFYVSKGDRVTRSETIGAVGSTGRSTGSHLHYEVMHKGQYVDPLDYMFDGYQMARLP